MSGIGLIVIVLVGCGRNPLAPILTITGNTAQSATNITSNTTWVKAFSPYRVTTNIVVDQGATLTIEAGVTVKFDPGTALYVDGTLAVLGTISQPVILTSAFSSYGSATVYFGKNSVNNQIRFCSVGNISVGTSAQLTLANSNLGGIDSVGTGTVGMHACNCTQIQNAGTFYASQSVISGGLVLRGGTAVIGNCTINGDQINSNPVINAAYSSVATNANAVLTNCVIVGNRGIGIQNYTSSNYSGGIWSLSGGSPYLSIANSNIYGNGVGTDYSYTKVNIASGVALNAQGNWWNTTSSAVIMSLVAGSVDYSNFLTAPVVDAGGTGAGF